MKEGRSGLFREYPEDNRKCSLILLKAGESLDMQVFGKITR